MSRIQTFDLSRFDGGLNLRANSQQIALNESPAMLNMSVDPVSGVASRNGFEDWRQVPTAEWNPKKLFVHTMSDGTDKVFVVSGGEAWLQEGGDDFSKLGLVAGGNPHGADFASWNNDVFVACGKNQPGYRWSESGLDELGDPSDAGWAADSTTVVSDVMPPAEHVAAHAGYLFVGNLLDGSDRLRVSQFNNPDSWEESHYIDFPEGGGQITALMPYRNHLLVFFANQVWALYGYSPASFTKELVAESVGAVSASCVTQSERAVYFVSEDQGVFEVTGERVVEVSRRLRPALSSANFGSDPSCQSLGWADRKLWWSVPYNEAATPEGVQSTFVGDPSINELGSWVLYRCGDGFGVGPVADSVERGPLGCSQGGPSVLRLNGREGVASDRIADVEYEFATLFRTPWVFGSGKTLKDRWKRPDLVVAQGGFPPYQLTMNVFHDYEEAKDVRRRTLLVGDDEADEFVWGVSRWGEASWGASIKGSAVERIGSLGTARSVQLEFRGELGKPWGLSNITFKFVPRRVR